MTNRRLNPPRRSVLTGLTLALVGCQSTARGPIAQETPPVPSGGPSGAVIPPAQGAVEIRPGFEPWLAKLRTDAIAKGISKPTVDVALSGITPIPRVIELDRRQPEFTQTFWRYLDGAVSARRVADGQAMLKQHGPLLKRIEDQYGVPPRFIVSFWGLETNYGKGAGTYPVIASLATLAYDGRRAEFFRGELFNALTIVDRGHIKAQEMLGSWAGAMGQTQFMPSTFLRYGVDGDKDGHIDIWRDVTDAFSSAANYLKSLGWDGNRTWGRAVALPADFDFNLASIDTNASEVVKPLTEWSKLGVRQPDGMVLPQQPVQAAVVVPAGAKGPAFLVYDNYRAILKWNRSTLYAIAVGHLADRITGGEALTVKRVVEEPLRREQVTVLQEGLRKLGYVNSEPDGVVGAGTRQGVRAFQRAKALQPDGYANRDILARVAQASGLAAPT